MYTVITTDDSNQRIPYNRTFLNMELKIQRHEKVILNDNYGQIIV